MYTDLGLVHAEDALRRERLTTQRVRRAETRRRRRWVKHVATVRPILPTQPAPAC